MIIGVAVAEGLEIVVVPITYYERRGANFVQGTYERDIAADITERINRFHDVRIDKTVLNDRLAGAMDNDARRVAEYYHVDEVLYGVVRNDGSSLTAELKIYNRRREDYGRIYASDTVDKYERLIETLSMNILDWYRTNVDKVDVLRSEVRDLQEELASLKEGLDEEARAERERARKEARESVEKEFVLRVPVMMGYWSYTKREWANAVQGTVEATAGIQMYPQLQFPPLFDMKNEMSLGLHIGYRNGVTRNKGDVLMNGLLINPVVGYHLNVYTTNWLYIGTGIFYELGIWEVESLKYHQSFSGYTVVLDYSYWFNRLITINFGADVYGYFTRSSSPVIRTYLGTTITVYGGGNGK
jgi:hypothetical protein